MDLFRRSIPTDTQHAIQVPHSFAPFFLHCPQRTEGTLLGFNEKKIEKFPADQTTRK